MYIQYPSWQIQVPEITVWHCLSSWSLSQNYTSDVQTYWRRGHVYGWHYYMGDIESRAQHKTEKSARSNKESKLETEQREMPAWCNGVGFRWRHHQLWSEKDVQRFNGMVKYLGKFIPNLSEKIALLRRLTEKKMEVALNNLKKQLTQEPILRFYDPARPITIASDASQSGLFCCRSTTTTGNQWRMHLVQ